MRRAYSLNCEDSAVLATAPSLDQGLDLAPSSSLTSAESVTEPADRSAQPGTHCGEHGPEEVAGDNLTRMLSVPTVNHAASLTKGDLVWLARRASLVSKTSFVSMPSAASSTLSSQTSVPSSELERSLASAAHTRRSSGDGCWSGTPLAAGPHAHRRASMAACSEVINFFDAALLMSRHSLASTKVEDEGECGKYEAESKAAPGEETKHNSECEGQGRLCPCDSAYVDRKPVKAVAAQAATAAPDAVKDQQQPQPPRPLSLQTEAAALRKAGLTPRSSLHSRQLLPGSPHGMPEGTRRRGSRDFDGLQIAQLIGKGSFGRVYQGTWRGNTVAVKVKP